MRWAVFITLVGSVLGTQAGYAQGEATESPDAGDELLEVYKDWTSRSQKLESGELIWYLRGRTRSSTYRIPADSDEAPAKPTPEELITIRFNQQVLRLEGNAEPAVQFRRPALPDSETWAADRDFREALVAGHFPEDKPRLSAVDYVVHLDRRRETHVWSNPSLKNSCRVVFPASMSGPLLNFDTRVLHLLPALWGLIEAHRLAICPDWWLETVADAGKGQIAQIRPLMQGRRCLAVEFPLKDVPIDVTCRLVVDPSRDNLVLRATYRNAERALLVQYDIDYDQDASGRWWPSAVTLVQFNGFGDPYDELYLVRQELRVDGASSQALTLEAPKAGTWVVDQSAGEQYVVERGGHHRPISLTEAMTQMTSSQQASSRYKTDKTEFAWSDIFVKMVTWPWILLTVAVIGCGIAVRNQTGSHLQSTLDSAMKSHPDGSTSNGYHDDGLLMNSSAEIVGNNTPPVKD